MPAARSSRVDEAVNLCCEYCARFEWHDGVCNECGRPYTFGEDPQPRVPDHLLSVAWNLAMKIERYIRPKLPDAPRLLVTVKDEQIKQLVIDELHPQVAEKIDWRIGSTNFVKEMG